jgi:hypothetical protein
MNSDKYVNIFKYCNPMQERVHDKTNNSSGRIATSSPVTSVSAFYCSQTPDDRGKLPKHVAKKQHLNKETDFIDIRADQLFIGSVGLL